MEWVLPFCRDATPLARAKWSSEDKAAACGARQPAMDPASSGCGVLVGRSESYLPRHPPRCRPSLLALNGIV